MLNSIRVRFFRGEEVKYISHLDLMKTFERALRRARIPIAYTEGFNPHPKMVFGLPLSVGVTSEAEYADFELSKPVRPSEFVERLNSQLPVGLRITDAHRKQDKENIMASITRASYNIYVCCDAKMGITEMKSLVSQLISKPEIVMKKKTKGGVKDTDIRPMIHKLDVKGETRLTGNYECSGNIYSLGAFLSAGSRGNLKPDILIDALKIYYTYNTQLWSF